MKKCPYCAEDIQDQALVCKHCGRELLPINKPVVSPLLLALFILGVILMACGWLLNNF